MAETQPQDVVPVQVVITNQQAYLLGVAADEAATTKGISEEARDNLERLSVFFYDVSTDPENYPVYTPPAVAMVRSIFARPQGPAQPQTRKNKRKARQEARMSVHKHRRRNRQAAVAAFNKLVEEALAAELEANPTAGVGEAEWEATRVILP